MLTMLSLNVRYNRDFTLHCAVANNENGTHCGPWGFKNVFLHIRARFHTKQTNFL